jgi:hypothetical protein
VVISDSLRQASAARGRAFAFLITEYGYRRDRPRFRWGGFELRYRGPVMGVRIDWSPPPGDPLTAWLVRLADGAFPTDAVTIHPTTELHYFDLGDLDAISGQQREIPERELYAMPDESKARALANSLRSCGADLLSGDLARLPQLEQRIRDRARRGQYSVRSSHRPPPPRGAPPPAGHDG